MIEQKKNTIKKKGIVKNSKTIKFILTQLKEYT